MQTLACGMKNSQHSLWFLILLVFIASQTNPMMQQPIQPHILAPPKQIPLTQTQNKPPPSKKPRHNETSQPCNTCNSLSLVYEVNFIVRFMKLNNKKQSIIEQYERKKV